jgi:hypothetical protein
MWRPVRLIPGIVLAGIALAGTLGGCTSAVPGGAGARPAAAGAGDGIGGAGGDPVLATRSPAAPGPSAAGGTMRPALDSRVTPRVGPKTKNAAQAAAARFITLYATGRFGDMYQLLAEDSRQSIPLAAWLGVHAACRPRTAIKAGQITSVVVFGNTALVTRVTSGATSGHGRETFSLKYAGKAWGVSPGDRSIYQQPSLAADIAAARQAGFCGEQRIF